MVVVKKKPGEKDEQLIARFRKKMLSSGKLNEVRDNRRFKPPSEKKKEKRAEIKHRIELQKKRRY